MLRDAWDDIKLRVSISRLYWLYMQNNTILLPIMMKRYTEKTSILLLQISKILNLNIYNTTVLLNFLFVDNEQLDLS